jgi:hypothetical protein
MDDEKADAEEQCDPDEDESGEPAWPPPLPPRSGLRGGGFFRGKREKRAGAPDRDADEEE